MSEYVQGEAPAALTPRLVFDIEKVNEDDIPQFLRNQRHTDTSAGTDQKPAIVPKASEPIIEISEPEASKEIAIPADTVTGTISSPAEVTEPVSAKDDDILQTTKLENMTVEELRRHEEEIQQRILEKQKAERQDAINQIVEVVEMFKIPVEDLVEALGGLKVKRKGVKATPKYRDPVSGMIWTGRGKEPAWIKGKDRKAFLIK